MNHSEELDQLGTALAAAQGDLENVAKNSEGYGYNYADLGSVLSMIRPHFSKHGLAIIQMPSNGESGGICVTTRLIHSSGQWIEESLEMPVEGGKNLSGAQAAGVVITYCRRYAAAAFSGIAQEDPDAAKQGEVEKKNMPKRSSGRKPQSVAQTVMDESIGDVDLSAATDYITGLTDAVAADDKVGGVQLFKEMDNDMKVVVWNKLDSKVKSTIKGWEQV